MVRATTHALAKFPVRIGGCVEVEVVHLIKYKESHQKTNKGREAKQVQITQRTWVEILLLFYSRRSHNVQCTTQGVVALRNECFLIAGQTLGMSCSPKIIVIRSKQN